MLLLSGLGNLVHFGSPIDTAPPGPNERTELGLSTTLANLGTGHGVAGELPWPDTARHKNVEQARQKAQNGGMNNGEVKLHRVVWEGKIVEICCGEDMLPLFCKHEGFLRALWEQQQEDLKSSRTHGPAARQLPHYERPRLVVNRSEGEMAAIEERKQARYKPRRVEWDGKVLEFRATDEEFAELAQNDDYLRNKWYMQEGRRIYEEQRRTSESSPDGLTPHDG